MPRGAGTSAAYSSFASLERTLDRTIEHLTAGSQTRDVRALIIEARRLRSVIANWRSIPPPPDVHDEMLDRVLQLSNAVGSVLGPVDDAEDDPPYEDSAPEPVPESEPDLQLDFEPAPAGMAARRDFGTGRAGDPRASAARRPAARRAPEPPAQARGTDPARRAGPGRPAGRASRPFDEPDDLDVYPRRGAPEPAPASTRGTDPSRRAGPGRSTGQATGPRARMERVDEPDDLDVYALDFEPRLYTHHAPTRRADGDDVAPDRTSSLPEPPRPAVAAPPVAAQVEVAHTSSSPQPPREPITSVGPAGREPITSVGPAVTAEPGSQVSLPAGITTYGAPPVVSYETEAETFAVPRTQIVAHSVKLSEPLPAELVYLMDPYSERADAYRAIRRRLTANAALRVLGVTSAQPREGKTVFAMNLALALRERVRERVLLVEATLKSPVLGRTLGFDAPQCFIAQLASHAEDPRAPWVVAEPMPKLHVMAIDPTTPHDPLLDPVTFSMGMERLKQAGYEYIIVDCPAVLGGVDCNVISDSVDAMILTALPLKSKRKEMRKAVEQLEPAPILGVVVLEV